MSQSFKNTRGAKKRENHWLWCIYTFQFSHSDISWVTNKNAMGKEAVVFEPFGDSFLIII